MRALTLALILFAIPASAAEKYLSYPDLTPCRERSRQQCVAQGCDGVSTRYWWRCEKLENDTAVLVIEQDRTEFSETYKGSGLSSQEQSTLKNTPTGTK